MKLTDGLPKYILSKKQLSFNVVLTALFSLTSAIMLSAISFHGWFNLTARHTVWLAIAFWISGTLLVSLSRLWLGSLKDRNITVLGYLGWCFAEMLAITLLYTLLTLIAIDRGWETKPSGHLCVHSVNCLIFCIFGLGIPNVISVLYCAVSERDKTIRLMNFNTVVSDSVFTPQTDKKILLYDNSGTLKLIVNQSNLFYIESNDNYIKVWYQDTFDELKQYMLRCRLKTIEESFADSDLVRCHRQYIVNINKIVQMTRQKDGTFSINLGLNTAPIPVSKTYEDKFIARFNSR